MIYGIGIDLVEINRIERIYKKWGDRFINKILTPREKGSIAGTISRYLASRFAAKEAFVKALGTGFSESIGLKDIEIISESNNPPNIRLYGRPLEIQKQKRLKKIFLSISHEKNMAAAMVIIEA